MIASRAARIAVAVLLAHLGLMGGPGFSFPNR